MSKTPIFPTRSPHWSIVTCKIWKRRPGLSTSLQGGGVERIWTARTWRFVSSHYSTPCRSISKPQRIRNRWKANQQKRRSREQRIGGSIPLRSSGTTKSQRRLALNFGPCPPIPTKEWGRSSLPRNTPALLRVLLSMRFYGWQNHNKD